MPEHKPQKRKAPSRQAQHAKQRVTQTAREAQALAMRTAGASYEQIARGMGCRSKATAWKLVESALRKTIQEPADQVRSLELARLDRWLLQLNTAIMAGSLEAMDRGLKIMTRRATLLGLDAPAKVAPTTPDGEETWEPRIVWLPSKSPTAEEWAAQVDRLAPRPETDTYSHDG